tara:strand:- start:4212 stop:4403 length:192 start_codon:yes stop_codon:yes gene_type:complete
MAVSSYGLAVVDDQNIGIGSEDVQKKWDVPEFFSEYPLKCDNYATVSLCIYKVSGHGVVLMWF